MHAVFQIGSHQFAAEEGETLRVPLLNAEPGSKVDISEVLLIKGDGDATVGTPLVENAKIEAEVLGHGKDDKVLVYKFKRRTKYRNLRGHRQDYSEIKISRIVAP